MRIPPLPHLTRRRFLGLTAGSVVAAGAYAWRVEPHWVEVVRRDLPLRGLPSDLAGRTLAQISDLHVGPVVDLDYLVDCVQRVAELRPDVVAVTGDFMSWQWPRHVDDVATLLGHLPRPPLGVYAVLGNHDYGDAWRQGEVADRLAARLRDVGVDVLRNERRDVAGLPLVGADDLWARRCQPEDALAGVDPSRDAVVLCHNPDAADKPALAGVRGWILAGHTHGGQCKPPFLPPPMLPVKNRRYTAGAFDLGGGRHMYINRGLGHLTRVRFNVRPEITVFHLAPAQA